MNCDIEKLNRWSDKLIEIMEALEAFIQETQGCPWQETALLHEAAMCLARVGSAWSAVVEQPTSDKN